MQAIAAGQDVAELPKSKYLARRLPVAAQEASQCATDKIPVAETEVQGGLVQRATSYADRRVPALLTANSGLAVRSCDPILVEDQEEETSPSVPRQPYLLRRRRVDFPYIEFEAPPQGSAGRLSIHGRGSHAFRSAEGLITAYTEESQATKRGQATQVSSSGGYPQEYWEPVLLNIYDLGDSKMIQGLNVILKSIGSGAYHAAVQVYGEEWSFGGLSLDDPIEEGFETGIWSCRPQGSKQHSYRESIAMGHTTLSHLQVLEIVARIMDDWPMNSYQLLRRNCCHFCNTFCQLLGVGTIPTWVLNLAGVGASLESVQTSTLQATVSAAFAVKDLALGVRKKCA